MKISIIVDEKQKSRELKYYDYDNSNNNNSKNKARPLKFIGFSLLIDENILSDLQL